MLTITHGSPIRRHTRGQSLCQTQDIPLFTVESCKVIALRPILFIVLCNDNVLIMPCMGYKRFIGQGIFIIPEG